MPKPPNITPLPTLAELIQNSTQALKLQPEALARLAAAITYATTMRASGGESRPEDIQDGGNWIGVREASALTGFPIRWFFRRARQPFARRLSRKTLLVDVERLRRAIAAGDVKPPTKRN